jgi:acetyl esterase/lipase
MMEQRYKKLAADKIDPTPLFHNPTDVSLHAQNDNGVRNSMAYSLALRNAKVPVELHLYAEGGHALASDAPTRQLPNGLSCWRNGSGRSG